MFQNISTLYYFFRSYRQVYLESVLNTASEINYVTNTKEQGLLIWDSKCSLCVFHGLIHFQHRIWGTINGNAECGASTSV